MATKRHDHCPTPRCLSRTRYPLRPGARTADGARGVGGCGVGFRSARRARGSAASSPPIFVMTAPVAAGQTNGLAKRAHLSCACPGQARCAQRQSAIATIDGAQRAPALRSAERDQRAHTRGDASLEGPDGPLDCSHFRQNTLFMRVFWRIKGRVRPRLLAIAQRRRRRRID